MTGSDREETSTRTGRTPADQRPSACSCARSETGGRWLHSDPLGERGRRGGGERRRERGEERREEGKEKEGKEEGRRENKSRKGERKGQRREGVG